MGSASPAREDVGMSAETETSGSASRIDPASIVVGHDGSPGADQALAEAMVLGRALGAPVVLVRAWSVSTAPRPADWELGYVPGFEAYAGAVHQALVDDVRPGVAAFPDVAVEYREPHAGAAQSLVDLSHGARMLVVGARGLGGLTGLLLGSVSEQCVRHAACPVLVIPDRR